MNGGPRGDAGAPSIPGPAPAATLDPARRAPEPMEPWTRVRVVFGKEGRLRFLGQLDLGRTLERAIRRSGLPARFSEGFNPRIRLSFPCASPTGMASRCEIVELQVAAPAGAAEVREALRREMPEGLPALSAEPVPAGERLFLEAAAYAARPREGEPGIPGGEEAVAALLARPEIPVERRGRRVDLRPLLLDLRAEGGGILVRLRFLESGATARPEDVVGALGAPAAGFLFERTGMSARLRGPRGESVREYGGPA